MLVDGLSFPATTIRYDDLRGLRTAAGNSALLPTFTPVDFPHNRHIWRLLYNCFFCHDICSYLTGTFVLFMAGIFNHYTSASIFVAMSNSPIVRRIFRKEPQPLGSFYIHGFLFTYLDDDDNTPDIFYYDVSCGDFKMTIIFYGIDTTPACEPSSNLDFVHFIWTYYERYHFAKYCLTLVNRDYPSLPELVCLKYYRAESCGWRDFSLCVDCVNGLQTRLRPFTGCVHPDEACSCSVCLRQPPSLLSPDSNMLFNVILDLENFTLTSETTYQQYAVATKSNKVPHQQLLPPDYPDVLVRFRCDVFARKLHHHCPGNGTWEVEMKRTFHSHADAIGSLSTLQTLFWCTHCNKGLFFSPDCIENLHPVI